MHRTLSSYLNPFPSCLNPLPTPVFFVEFGKGSYVLWKYYWISPFTLGIGARPDLDMFLQSSRLPPILAVCPSKADWFSTCQNSEKIFTSSCRIFHSSKLICKWLLLLVLPWKQNYITTILHANQKQNLKLLIIYLFCFLIYSVKFYVFSEVQYHSCFYM